MENKPDHWARVASADLEQVRKSVSDMIKSHQLKQLRADQTLQTRLRHAQFGQVALSRLGYGADVHIQPDHLAGFYLIQMPQYGTAKVRCGNQTVDSSPYAATILNPNEDVDMIWHANNEQLMLKIDRNLVEQAARGMGLDVGPQGLLFPVRLQAHTQPSWQIMLRYVLDCARNYEDIRRSPLIINQLEQLAVTTLLDLHPPAQIQPVNPTRILPRHLKKSPAICMNRLTCLSRWTSSAPLRASVRARCNRLSGITTGSAPCSICARFGWIVCATN